MVSTLIVRNVDPEIIDALNELAAAHGHSAETEHRNILREALRRPVRKPFTEFLAELPDVGVDEDFRFRD